jgi:hypothetical protein
VLAVLIGLSFASVAAAQAPQASPPADSGGISSEQLAEANNPIADMNALNFHNFWAPSIRGLPNDSSNTLYVRPVIVSGRHVIRATIPLMTAPSGGGFYASGIGDINIFDAIKLTGDGAKTDIAVGPMLVFPSASDDALGQGKWQAGVAGLVIHPVPGGSVLGALVTYQTDIAGDADRDDTSIMSAQPIVTLSMGGGYYFRSTGQAIFDLHNDRALVPIGVGLGRVFKAAGAVMNAFIEPQFTVYSKGDAQPAVQIFMSLSMQWPKKPKG